MWKWVAIAAVIVLLLLWADLLFIPSRQALTERTLARYLKQVSTKISKLERHGDGVALYPGCGPQAACEGSDGEDRTKERNYNVYSLTTQEVRAAERKS